MRRSTRFNRPGLSGSSRSAMLLGADGDGSTLSLDFTTGVLDPRLSFTRASNATFINSSGLVQWAASNHAPRTNWNFTSPTGSGWNAATLIGTGTFQWVGNGTVIAASGSAGQSYTSITTPTGIAEGLRYVMSVTASSVTGSPTIQSIFDFTGASGNTYFKNGAAATAGTTVASGDRISVSAIASSTTMNVRLGCGAWFANRTNESVTLTQFHWHPGSAPVAYYENTGTSPLYDSARFDYDPTTLAPRGLLIEGQVANIVTYSGDLTQNGVGHWSGRTNLVTTNWTGFTAPDNTASAVKIIPDTTSGRHTIENNAPSIVNGTTYTASAFVKADGYTVASLVVAGGQARRNFTLTGAGSLGSQFGATNTATIAPVGTQGWYRVTMTWTSTLTGGAAFWIGVPQNATTDVVSSWSGNGTSAIQAWGAQLEAGSGASSYIPTGASQATRVADSCVMTGTNFSSWYGSPSSSSVLYEGTIVQNPDGYRKLVALSSVVSDTTVSNFSLTVAGAVNNRPALNSYINSSNNVDAYVPLAGAVTNGTQFRLAARMESGNHRISKGGQVGTSSYSTAPGYPQGLVALSFGADGSLMTSQWVKQFKYYPFSLTNSQMDAWSA
jgi:hypothetical protein